MLSTDILSLPLYLCNYDNVYFNRELRALAIGNQFLKVCRHYVVARQSAETPGNDCIQRRNSPVHNQIKQTRYEGLINEL